MQLTLFILSLCLGWRVFELCFLQGNGCSGVLGLLDAGAGRGVVFTLTKTQCYGEGFLVSWTLLVR